MSNRGAQSLFLDDEWGRVQLFLEIINLLSDKSDKELKDIATQANVHWVTLYNWLAIKTLNPHINTLSRVAAVLGYRIALIQYGKPNLTRVK